jgi:hypothetical protein
MLRRILHSFEYSEKPSFVEVASASPAKNRYKERMSKGRRGIATFLGLGNESS